MNKEKLELVRKTIKELEEKHILHLEMDIIYEMDWQLEEELKEEDYCKLYEEIEYAYLKLEEVELAKVVRCAIDHKKEILNDDEDFDLREESCWY